MPLVIISGRPCTGKTKFANLLAQSIEQRGVPKEKIVVVNEEILKSKKKDCYTSTTLEKELRGGLKSGLEHNIKPDVYVIIDSLNYIKGYRYELYCCARTARTPHCVVWVASKPEIANSWNEERKEKDPDNQYSDDIFIDLRRRFEMPNDANRWDNPLYKVNMTPMDNIVSTAEANIANLIISNEAPTAPKVITKPKVSSWKPRKAKAVEEPTAQADVSTNTSESISTTQEITDNIGHVFFSGQVVEINEDLTQFSSNHEQTMDEIYNYLSNAQAPVPNSSTVVAHHAQADLLYELDRISQHIIQLLITHQSQNSEGTPLQLVDYDRSFTLHRHTSAAELQRLRRQYVKINAQHPPATTIAIGTQFIDFLAMHL